MTAKNDLVKTPMIPIVTTEKRRKPADFSQAVRISHIELKTNAVQIVFEHTYTRANNALFASTKGLRRRGKIATAKTAENTLSDMFDTFSTELSEALLKLQETVQDKVPEAMRRLVYNHVREFDVPASNGYSSRLINLTLQLDLLVCTVDLLEINGVLTPSAADQTTQSWIKRYRRFANAIQTLRVEVTKKLAASSHQQSASPKQD